MVSRSEVIEAIQQYVAERASAVTYVGALGSIFSWAARIDWGVVGGLLLGFAGLVVNWYFKRQANKRAEEAHRLWKDKIALMSRPMALPEDEG